MKNNMRKFIIIPLVIMTFFTCINFVSATSYVTMPSGGKNVRERPTQNSGLVKFLSENTKAELLETGVKGEGNSGCSKDWYKIKDLDDGRTGYICSAQVSVTELSDVDYNGDFEQQMLNQGFTPSYLPYLKTLHQKHPNWTFKAIKTGLDYNSSIGEQYTYGNSLVDGSDESLRSRDSYVYDASTGQYLNRGWDNGWYAANDKEQRELTTYTIPVQTGNAKTYTVNLHPSWNIKSVTSGEMNETVLGNVITELTSLQNKNQGTCGEVKINSVTKISNKLNIPEGVSVTFNKDVTVEAAGYIDGEGTVIKGPETTITKVVDNTNATDANKGLNTALNTASYDKVQLAENGITNLAGNIELTSGKKAILDLNGQDLSLADANTFKIDGEVKATDKTEGVAAAELTITNSKEAGKTVASNEIKTKTGIENNGKLTIGEKAVEGEKAKDLVKISSATGATAATITNSADATLTIESGIIENTSDLANKAVVENKGTLEIKDGKIEAGSTTARIPALLNEGTATITNGEILRSKNSANVGAGYYVVVNHGEMTIDGGTFTEGDNTSRKMVLNGTSALIENGYTTGVSGLGKTAELTINDGTFKGGRYVVASDYAGDTKVYGGKYEAVPDTNAALTTAGKTRSIFKVVGKLELKLDESKEPEFNLGAGKSQTALALIGDQYLSEYDSKTDSMHECKLTIHPFSPEIVKVNKKGLTKYEDIGAKIVNENTTTSTQKSKSDIVVYVGNSDAKEAGKQLMAVIKNSIASKMTGIDAEKNKVTIILDSDVEIESDLDTAPNYETSKENTTLNLNGHKLTIHKLAVFKKNVNVIDESSDKKGTIVLNKDNTDTTIYSNGDFAKDVDLSQLAAQDVDKE